MLPPINNGKGKGKWIEDGEDDGGFRTAGTGKVKIHKDANMEDLVERDAYEQR